MFSNHPLVDYHYKSNDLGALYGFLTGKDPDVSRLATAKERWEEDGPFPEYRLEDLLAFIEGSNEIAQEELKAFKHSELLFNKDGVAVKIQDSLMRKTFGGLPSRVKTVDDLRTAIEEFVDEQKLEGEDEIYKEVMPRLERERAEAARRIVSDPPKKRPRVEKKSQI